MSEPMTNHQIEDVLSSIRRLVSDDLRPRPRAAGAGDAGDKLLLTPALRIVPASGADASDPVAEDASSQGDGTWSTLEDAPADAFDPATVQLSFLSPVEAPDFDATDADEDAADQAEPAMVRVGDPSGDPSERDPAAAPVTGVEPWAAQAAGPAGGQQSLVFRSRRDPDVAADDFHGQATLAGTAPPLELAQPFWPEGGTAPKPDPDHDDRAGALRPEEPHTGALGEGAPRDDGAQDAEPFVMAVPETVLPVMAANPDHMDDVQPMPIEQAAQAIIDVSLASDDHASSWDDGADAETIAAIKTAAADPQPDAAPEPMDRPGTAASDPAPLIDEAALISLVRGIIQDELQGALGERITRNVRKLVRAEIHRVLASRDIL